MVLKNPFFFGFYIVGFVALQLWASYLSFQYFLAGDFLTGFLFFLVVPGLAFLMGIYILWFRRQRMAAPGK